MVSGSGTSGSPFILTSLDDLELIGTVGYALTAYYKLGSDIDASETQDPGYNSGEGWIPIPGEFKGNFNGDNHTISGLYINRPTTDNVGFFTTLRDSGKAQDLTISGEIIGQNNVGGISGNTYFGSLVNCTVNGTVTGTDAVGGINGRSYPAAYFENCFFNGTINGHSFVAGISGSWQSWGGSGNLINCKAEGTITATGSYVGGIFGHIWAQGKTFSNIIIDNLIFICSSTTDAVGGFAGQLYEGALDGITVEMDIEARNAVGGLVGIGYPFYGAKDCNFTGNVTGFSQIGGIVGQGDGHYGGKYETSNCSIEGIITGSAYVGAISGDLRDAHVKNCTINRNEVSIISAGADFVGGLCGRIYGTFFTNCHSDIDLSGRDYVGGIVGYHYPANNITECSYNGTLTGRSYVGGISGYIDRWSLSSTILRCFTKGTINATGDYVGGISGRLRATLQDSYSLMDITGNTVVGGMVGQCWEASIINCFCAGALTGVSSNGGLVATNYASSATSSYWDSEVSGQATSALGTPLLTSQMTCGRVVLETEWETFQDLSDNTLIGVTYDNMRFWGETGGWLANLTVTSPSHIPVYSNVGNGPITFISGGNKYEANTSTGVMTLIEENVGYLKTLPSALDIYEDSPLLTFLEVGEELIDTFDISGELNHTFLLTDTRIIKLSSIYDEETEEDVYTFVEDLSFSNGLVFVASYWELDSNVYKSIITSTGSLITLVANGTDSLSVYETITLPSWGDFMYDYGLDGTTKLDSTIIELFNEASLEGCIEYITGVGFEIALFPTKFTKYEWDEETESIVGTDVNLLQSNPHHVFEINTYRPQ